MISPSDILVEHFVSREDCENLMNYSGEMQWAQLLLATCKEPSLDPFDEAAP